MELPESVETINKRITDYYGLSLDGHAKFRVVWSDDQIENQYTNYTAEGFELPYKILRKVPKYRQYIQSKYILERLSIVPEVNQEELGLKLSYEPIWVFEDAQGFPLPPKWEVIVILINTLHEQVTKPKDAPYKQAEEDANTVEAMEEKARKLQEALFGNETSVTDALAYGTGISLAKGN